jgi:hypothetical protein
MPKKVRRGTKIEISENVVFSEQYSGQPNGGEGGALDQADGQDGPRLPPTLLVSERPSHLAPDCSRHAPFQGADAGRRVEDALSASKVSTVSRRDTSNAERSTNSNVVIYFIYFSNTVLQELVSISFLGHL